MFVCVLLHITLPLVTSQAGARGELEFVCAFVLPFEVTSTVGSSTKSMVTSIGLVGYFDDYYAGLQIISMWRDSPTLNGHIGKGSLWIWMIDIHKQSIISL